MDMRECVICFDQIDTIASHARCKQCYQISHLHCAWAWVKEKGGCPFCRYPPRRSTSPICKQVERTLAISRMLVYSSTPQSGQLVLNSRCNLTCSPDLHSVCVLLFHLYGGSQLFVWPHRAACAALGSPWPPPPRNGRARRRLRPYGFCARAAIARVARHFERGRASVPTVVHR